jgi:hypothetical protein
MRQVSAMSGLAKNLQVGTGFYLLGCVCSKSLIYSSRYVINNLDI